MLLHLNSFPMSGNAVAESKNAQPSAPLRGEVAFETVLRSFVTAHPLDGSAPLTAAASSAGEAEPGPVDSSDGHAADSEPQTDAMEASPGVQQGDPSVDPEIEGDPPLSVPDETPDDMTVDGGDVATLSRPGSQARTSEPILERFETGHDNAQTGLPPTRQMVVSEPLPTQAVWNEVRFAEDAGQNDLPDATNFASPLHLAVGGTVTQQSGKLPLSGNFHAKGPALFPPPAAPAVYETAPRGAVIKELGETLPERVNSDDGMSVHAKSRDLNYQRIPEIAVQENAGGRRERAVQDLAVNDNNHRWGRLEEGALPPVGALQKDWVDHPIPSGAASAMKVQIQTIVQPTSQAVELERQAIPKARQPLGTLAPILNTDQIAVGEPEADRSVARARHDTAWGETRTALVTEMGTSGPDALPHSANPVGLAGRFDAHTAARLQLETEVTPAQRDVSSTTPASPSSSSYPVNDAWGARQVAKTADPGIAQTVPQPAVSTIADPVISSDTYEHLSPEALSAPELFNRNPIQPGQASQLSNQPVPRQLLQALVEHPVQPNEKITITLSPEELGRVKLSAAQTDNGIVLLVQAERPETLDLMRRHMPDLMQGLRDLGFGDVSYFGQERSDQPPRDHGAGQQGSESPTETEPQYITSSGLDLRL